MPTGTVILSSRAPIGKTAIAGCEMCCNQGFKNLICSDRIFNEYLYYFLSAKTEYLNSLGRGATFKEISKAIVENIMIPLPPISEQKQIAANFTQIQALITLRKAQLQQLDQLVKSRFIELFYGKGYPTLSWNEVFITTTGKLDSNAMVENGEYPFFTCAKEILRIDKYAFDQEALLLAGNNAAGKYDVKYYKGKFNAYQRTYVLSLKHNWSYQLFRYQLEDKLVYLQQQSLGGLTKYLTLKILADLDFILPPMDLQNQFAAFVEQTDKLKLAVQEALAELETLKKSLMQQYFG
jgi:restriction endonuclease S subunit